MMPPHAHGCVVVLGDPPSVEAWKKASGHPPGRILTAGAAIYGMTFTDDQIVILPGWPTDSRTGLPDIAAWNWTSIILLQHIDSDHQQLVAERIGKAVAAS